MDFWHSSLQLFPLNNSVYNCLIIWSKKTNLKTYEHVYFAAKDWPKSNKKTSGTRHGFGFQGSSPAVTSPGVDLDQL